jgi:hypothetical protein
MDFEEQYILFLEGIYTDDYTDIEDQFKIKILNNIQEEDTNLSKKRIIYDKIQDGFTSLEKWKASTNIKCWFCDLSFKNQPIFIPNNILNTGSGKELTVIGNFCSFGCAKAHIITNKSIHDDKEWEYDKYLKYLYKLFYKKSINDIIPSPNKYKLVHYGGTLSIKEYKEQLIKINKLNL